MAASGMITPLGALGFAESNEKAGESARTAEPKPFGTVVPSPYHHKLGKEKP